MSEQQKSEYFQLRAQGFSHGEAYAAIYGGGIPAQITPQPLPIPSPPSPVAVVVERRQTPTRRRIGGKSPAVFSADQMRSFSITDFETMRTLAPETYQSAFGGLNVDPWLTPRLGFAPSQEELAAIRALGPDARTARMLQEVAKRFGRTVSSVGNLHRRLFKGQPR